MQTITIEQRREQDYERFEANRRFEEMTDIAERLSYPIDTTIQYEFHDDALYATTDRVERPFHNQTFQAMQAGELQYIGDQSFQRTRLRLEHEEALLCDQLAAGMLGGNVMFKFSKVPDAVVEGRTNINGYRRDLHRSFVRMYYTTDTGVNCRLFTLDHNHTEGVKRAGELLGIDATLPSEEVLAAHTTLNVPGDPEEFVARMTERVIEAYDQAMFMDTAKPTHAGSYFLNEQDAMSAITTQPQLLQQHMDAITSIMARGLGEESLEHERRKTAAAIKLATEGHDVSSSGDSSVAAEVASGDYGRECATPNGMNQAAQSAENKWSPGECQVCFAKTMVGSCAVCASCAAADDRGIDLLKLRDHNLQKQRRKHLAHEAIKATVTSNEKKPPKRQTLQDKYGEKITIKKQKTIGGEDTLVLNTAGKVIGKI